MKVINLKIYNVIFYFNIGKEKFDGITILDGLSASGLRPIRFLKELDGVKKVYANDLSEDAHK